MSVTTPPIQDPPGKPTPDASSAMKNVNWQDFRDHLTTADKEGRRTWLYPKKPRGRFYEARILLSYFLLAVMFAGPFIRIHGNPLLMINIVERRFSILGHVFWPQDMFLFAIALLLFLTGIVVFTAAFGRLWCGWTCPQTVLMETVFRRIEYWIEGDSAAQRALHRAPWTASKIVKKVGKQLIFLVLSFIIGNTLLAYIIGSDALIKIVTDDPRNHLEGLTFMVLFTLIFYAIFARFREQACTFICPYGRLQSTLLDENSIVVAYNFKRGENRGTLRRDQTWNLRTSEGRGDCIDCRECVVVCPTGIDIRNGTQMECVQCTACIDACDRVMDKIKRPRGLIGYASLNGIERGEKLRFTPRLKGYLAVLALLAVLFFALLFTRSDVEATFLRATGALFQQMPDGKISNLYTLKLFNKTQRDVPVQLRLENARGTVKVMGNELVVAPEKIAEASVLIELSPDQVKGGSTPLVIGVYSGDKRLQTIKTGFVGPRDDTGK